MSERNIPVSGSNLPLYHTQLTAAQVEWLTLITPLDCLETIRLLVACAEEAAVRSPESACMVLLFSLKAIDAMEEIHKYGWQPELPDQSRA